MQPSLQEIAQVIVFLCSDKASFVTGQVVAADGGFEATGAGLAALRGECLARPDNQTDGKGNGCQGQHAGNPYSGKPEQAGGKTVLGHQWYPSSGLTLPRNTQ